MEAAELWHAEHITKPLTLATCEEMCREHRSPIRTGFPRRRRPFSPESADPVDRGTRPHGEWTCLGSVRAGQRQLHAAAPAGQRLLPGHQRTASPPATIRLRRSATGLCEVVERDAATLWRLSGQARDGRPSIRRPSPTRSADGCSTGSPRPTSRCASGTRPAMSGSRASAASWRSRSGEFADPEYGNGCHPAREVALLRALTEAAQARVTYIIRHPGRLPLDAWEPSLSPSPPRIAGGDVDCRPRAVGALRQRALSSPRRRWPTISTGCSRCSAPSGRPGHRDRPQQGGTGPPGRAHCGARSRRPERRGQRVHARAREPAG